MPNRAVFFSNNRNGRNLQNPPGGKCSNIFDSTVSPPPFASPQRLKKLSEAYKSNVFGSGDLNCDINGNNIILKKNYSPKKKNYSPKRIDTQNRLFGDDNSSLSPKSRKISNTYKSNVFGNDHTSIFVNGNRNGFDKNSASPVEMIDQKWD